MEREEEEGERSDGEKREWKETMQAKWLLRAIQTRIWVCKGIWEKGREGAVGGYFDFALASSTPVGALETSPSSSP